MVLYPGLEPCVLSTTLFQWLILEVRVSSGFAYLKSCVSSILQFGRGHVFKYCNGNCKWAGVGRWLTHALRTGWSGWSVCTHMPRIDLSSGYQSEHRWRPTLTSSTPETRSFKQTTTFKTGRLICEPRATPKWKTLNVRRLEGQPGADHHD